jgi:hypothetical protein
MTEWSKPGWSEGDLIPIKTSMGNIINCEIKKLDWAISFGKKEITMLLCDKALAVICDEIEYRRNNLFDNIFLNTAPERSGKSMYSFAKKRFYESPLYRDKEKFADIIKTDNWSAETICRESKVDLNEICFELTDFREQLARVVESKMEDGVPHIIVLDEAGTGLFALEWYSREQTQIYKEFQVIGKRRCVVDLNLPHKDDLNNRMRDRRVRFWSHVMTVNNDETHSIERGYVEVRKSEPDKWKMDIFWQPWIVCKFPFLNDEIWENYEKKKDKYIDIVSSQQEVDNSGKGNGVTGNKYYRENMLLINEMLEPTIPPGTRYSEKKIGSLIGISQSAMAMRIKTYQKQEEQRIEMAMRAKEIQEKIKEE